MTPHPFPLVRLSAYVLLSLTDLCLTWLLLRYSDGNIIEDNPIAAEWFDRFGVEGLFVFKVGAVTVGISAVLLICAYRPRLGRWLLNFGCAILGLVIGYTYWILRAYL